MFLFIFVQILTPMDLSSFIQSPKPLKPWRSQKSSPSTASSTSSLSSISLSLMTLFVVYIPRFLTISLSSYLISDIPNFFEHLDKMGLTVSGQRPWINLLAWEHDLALGASELKTLVEYGSLIGRKGSRRKRCGLLCTRRWKKRGCEANSR